MDEVRKKVLIDLFGSPSTVLPALAGLSCLIASWAAASPILAFLGICGILGGIGIFASRIVYGLDTMTKRAWDYVEQKRVNDKNKELDKFFDMLENDDSRAGNSFYELRKIYANFQKNIKDGLIKGVARTVMAEKVDEIFDKCISQLKFFHELIVSSRGMSAPARRKSKANSDKILEDVSATVEQLAGAVQQCLEISARSVSGIEDLSNQRDDLARALEVIKQSEETAQSIVDGDRVREKKSEAFITGEESTPEQAYDENAEKKTSRKRIREIKG